MKKILITFTLALLLAGCSSSTGYTAGTYEVTVAGHNADMKVAVTFSDSKITEIVVSEHEETEGLSDPAFNDVIPAIIKAQSTKVDVAAGATVTSNAIIEAVNQATTLAKAS